MKNKSIYQILVFILAFIFFQFRAKAQTDEEQLKLIEKHIENLDLSADYNELSEYLSKTKSNKININKATPFQLYSLGFLSYEQIKAIINHRKKYGDFISINELQTIDSMTEDVIKKLKLHIVFIETDEKLNLFKSLKNSKKNLVIISKISTPLSKGYIDTSLDSADRFKGSPFISRIKFKSDYNEKLILGFNAEKDAGEEFFSGANKKGYDFYSGFIFIKKNKKIKSFVLGDYKADFGQGLVLSGGFNTSKNALVTNLKKSNLGIRPYNSFNENDFLRGSAITLNFKNTELSFLVSKNKIDAAFDTVITNYSEEIFIKSINETGYHRTAKEILNKNNSAEFIIAQNITHTRKNLSIGFTSLYCKTDYNREPGFRLYDKYYFASKDFFKGGINWDYYYKNFNFFGEVAAASNKSTGTICGANISLGNFADFSTVYRNYSKKFIPNYTNAFSENSKPMNENGFYSGILIFPSSKLQFSAFYDFYQMPWYTYFVDGANKGNDAFFEAKYEPDKSNLIYFRIRKKSELYNSDEGNFNNLNNEEKTTMRIHAEKSFSPVITAKFRVEFSNIKSAAGTVNKGNLFFTDITLKKIAFPVSANMRFTLFNTSDYSSGIYAMENDLLYSWSVPKFYDSGAKFYILLKMKYGKFNIQYKYSFLKYYNKNTIGSGNSEINSDNFQENSLLLNYRID